MKLAYYWTAELEILYGRQCLMRGWVTSVEGVSESGVSPTETNSGGVTYLRLGSNLVFFASRSLCKFRLEISLSLFWLSIDGHANTPSFCRQLRMDKPSFRHYLL